MRQREMPPRFHLGKISVRKICVFLVAICLMRWIIIMREGISTATHSMVITGRTAKYAWDIVADLNHFKVSDPKTLIVQITSDKFTHPEWIYSVILEQNDPDLAGGQPMTTLANYVVKPEGKYYIISADYRTCVHHFFCVYENSHINFRDLPSTASIVGYHSSSMTANVTIRLSWLAGFFFKSQNLMAKHWLRLDRLRRHMSLDA